MHKKNRGISRTPATILFDHFDDPHTQTIPLNFTSYTSKDKQRIRHDHIEAFGTVYFAKKLFKKS